MTYIHHRLDIYSIDIYLARTTKEWAQLRRKMPDRELGRVPAEKARTTHLHYDDTIIFWIKSERIDQLNVIADCAHEATHAAGFLYKAMGQKQDARQEPFAYLVGWLTAWLYQHVRDA